MSEASRFISTRGEAPETGFAEVLLAGLAPDGGLYMPAAWPRFSAAQISGFKGRRYQEVAFEILSRFAGDSFTAAELKEDIEAAYAGFEKPEIAPLSPMSGNRYLLELFHGPTFAFKDIALQILGRLFARALKRRGGRATVVGPETPMTFAMETPLTLDNSQQAFQYASQQDYNAGGRPMMPRPGYGYGSAYGPGYPPPPPYYGGYYAPAYGYGYPYPYFYGPSVYLGFGGRWGYGRRW